MPLSSGSDAKSEMTVDRALTFSAGKVMPVAWGSIISHNAGRWDTTVVLARIMASKGLIGGTIRVTFESGLLTTKISIKS